MSRSSLILSIYVLIGLAWMIIREIFLFSNSAFSIHIFIEFIFIFISAVAFYIIIKQSNKYFLEKKIAENARENVQRDLAILNHSLSEIIKSTGDAFLLFDSNNKLIQYNESALRYSQVLFGKRIENDCVLDDLLSPTHFSTFNVQLSKIREGEILNAQIETVRLNKVLTFKCRLNPVFVQNIFTYSYLIIRNTTRENQIQKNLSESQSKVDILHANIKEGVITIDENWKITSINQKGLSLLSIQTIQVIGISIFEIFPSILLSELHEKALVTKNQKQSDRFDFFYTPFLRWFEVNLFPGTNNSVMIIFNDITDQYVNDALDGFERDTLKEIISIQNNFFKTISQFLENCQAVLPGLNITIFQKETDNYHFFACGYSEQLTVIPTGINKDTFLYDFLEEMELKKIFSPLHPELLHDLHSNYSTKYVYSSVINQATSHHYHLLFEFDSEILNFEWYEALIEQIFNKIDTIFSNRYYFRELEKLSFITENSSNAHLTLDKNLKITWYNNSYLRFINLIYSETTFKDLQNSFVNTEFLGEAFKDIKEAVEQFNPIKTQITFTDIKGTKRIFFVEGKTLFNTSEMKYLLSLEDITSIVQNQQKLVENELFLRQITNSVPVLILKIKKDVSNNYSTLFVNEHINSLNLGLTKEQVEADFNQFISKLVIEEKNYLLSQLDISESRMELLEIELQFQDINNQSLWLKGLFSPQKLETNETAWFGTFQDVSEAKIMLENVKQSEKKHRNLFEWSRFGIIHYNSTGEVVNVNPAAKSILANYNIEFLSCNTDIHKTKIYNEDGNLLTIHDLPIMRALSTKQSQIGCILCIQHENQHEFSWIKIDAYPTFENDKNAVFVYSIIEDITDKYTAQKRIEESNLRFNIVSKAVNETIWDYNILNNTLIWSDGIERFFGYKPTEAPTSENWNTFVHPKDYKAASSHFNEVLKNREMTSWSFEYRFRKSNHQYADVSDKAIIIRDKMGNAIRVIGSMRDVSDEKIFEMKKESLINETQTYERNRFSMELHDGLAQYLVALSLYLNQFENGQVVNESYLQLCKSIVKEALDHTRSLCYSLSPPELQKGLIPGIESLFDRISSLNNIGFEINLDKTVDFKNFKEVEIYNIYRIIQEFVNNSLKHSKCTNINCTVLKQNNTIKIFVKDNGIGFNSETVHKGLGLQNIENRAKIANVEIAFSSEINVGSQIEIKLKANKIYLG